MIAEYTSAAYTAQALHWMIQVALPEGLQDLIRAALTDALAKLNGGADQLGDEAAMPDLSQLAKGFGL